MSLLAPLIYRDIPPSKSLYFSARSSSFATLELPHPPFHSKEAIMGKIASLEYFRVPPRWLFVKITDDAGNVGWGEASLEGHTQTVEGCLEAWKTQYTGMEAE
jgi:hypothetical protein